MISVSLKNLMGAKQNHKLVTNFCCFEDYEMFCGKLVEKKNGWADEISTCKSYDTLKLLAS